MSKPVIQEKTYRFGLEVVRLCMNMPKNSLGFAISNQLVRSATSIGANVEEAQDGMSRADFLKCMNISLKEAKESRYWLKISIDTGLVLRAGGEKLLADANEIVYILTKIVKTTKLNSHGA